MKNLFVKTDSFIPPRPIRAEFKLFRKLISAVALLPVSRLVIFVIDLVSTFLVKFADNASIIPEDEILTVESIPPIVALFWTIKSIVSNKVNVEFGDTVTSLPEFLYGKGYCKLVSPFGIFY
jgi:hypothetical protein